MKRFLLLLIVVSLPFAASAQLTLDQCRDMARRHYPEVARYDLIAQTEAFNLGNASRGWIPQVSLSGQATWQSAAATFPGELRNMMTLQGLDLQGIPQDQYKIALDVNQTIYDGGLSRANKKLAHAEAAEQRLSSDVSLYSIDERISEIFFSILLLDENLSMARSRSGLLDANAGKLESLVRSGVALQSDLDLVRVEQLSLEQQIAQNESSRAAFTAMLETFIGEPLGGRNLVKPERVLVAKDNYSRPELSLIDAQIARVDAQEGLISSGIQPKVSFFAQGYYGNPGLDMFRAMTSRAWTWNAYLGVRMQWNVSALFTRKEDLRRLETARSTLALQKDVFNFNNSLQTTRQNSEISRIQEALSQDDRIVELRAGIRRAAESQLDHGIIDTAALLQRITEEFAARSSRCIHEIELLKAQYQLKHILNQ